MVYGGGLDDLSPQNPEDGSGDSDKFEVSHHI